MTVVQALDAGIIARFAVLASGTVAVRHTLNTNIYTSLACRKRVLAIRVGLATEFIRTHIHVWRRVARIAGIGRIRVVDTSVDAGEIGGIARYGRVITGINRRRNTG